MYRMHRMHRPIKNPNPNRALTLTLGPMLAMISASDALIKCTRPMHCLATPDNKDVQQLQSRDYGKRKFRKLRFPVSQTRLQIEPLVLVDSISHGKSPDMSNSEETIFLSATVP